MSIFENPEKLLKKHYIIHSSASACAIFAGLPLCFVVHGRMGCKCEHYAVVCKSGKNIQKMVQKVEKSFWRILGWPFLGVFWIIRFSGRQRLFKRWSKSWDAVFQNSWLDTFRGCFEYSFYVVFSVRWSIIVYI